MGETLNLRFRSREDSSFELQVNESWSGHSVKGDFIPPYTARQLQALSKKLSTLESDDKELREIGQRLFQALCGVPSVSPSLRNSSEHSVQAMLRSVIQRTIRRRGTVALTLFFSPGCEDFVSYPWELLHNGEHFLLASGVFTLTRALLRPDLPARSELPVYPPLRMLYIGASPIDLPSLEIEQSFESLRRALTPLIEEGQLVLDRLEPPIFDELVRYLNFFGGAAAFEDQKTLMPCYAIHFDGYAAFGRLCPAEGCNSLNDANARICSACKTPISRVKPQTYLCFCDDEGHNKYVGIESLRELFVSSDIRLAVFCACETAGFVGGRTNQERRSAIDASLATTLVVSSVPAVVTLPFSPQYDLSPVFMYHFYDAVASGRTLEEALARARQAMLPIKQQNWFVPVLSRHVFEEQIGPVPFLIGRDELEQPYNPFAHLVATRIFVGREQELLDIGTLLREAAIGEELQREPGSSRKLRPGMHHLALIGPAGIGKSELAFEAVRRNTENFPGGIIGVSLQGGKSLSESLIEIAHSLHLHSKALHTADTSHRQWAVLNAFQGLAKRDLPCLLLLDSFEEVQEHADAASWYRFLCSLPEQVVVLITSRSNPAAVASLQGASCHWYEYPVGKMTSEDILKLFAELASGSGLDERIHLSEPRQQEILQEICTLLDGYPLGAQLIFGTARSIQGKIFAPEAATRSLEDVRDELRETPLEGIWTLLDIAYRRLSPSGRLLLPYLAIFKLPFSHQQILKLVAPTQSSAALALGRLGREDNQQDVRNVDQEMVQLLGTNIPIELRENWRAARDELVQTSFIQFDGRVYTIHPQVRHFALTHLQEEERRRVHRVVAVYYSSQPQPSPDEWFAAFEHLEDAGEPEDLHMAIHLLVRAAWALRSRGYAAALRAMLHRAHNYALSLGDAAGEARVQFCLGAILRQLGKYVEALSCLTRSLKLHHKLHERHEEAWALFELAMLFREQGQYSQASEHAQEAIPLFREANDAKGVAWMQTVLGEVGRGHGNYYDALGHFELALATFRNLPNDDGYPWTLRDRGTVHEALGNYAQAQADYEESLRLFNSLGSRYGQAWVLADQSIMYVDQAKLDLAKVTSNEALTIFREQGTRLGEGWVLRVLGDISRIRRSYNDARAYYNEALSIFNDLDDRVDQAWVMNSLGAISFAEGEYMVAKEQYEQARTIAYEQEARQLLGHALRGSGDVAGVMRQFTEAERYYEEAITLVKNLDAPAERSTILHHLGDLRLAQGRHRDALAAWVESLVLDPRLRHPERKSLEDKIQALVVEQHLDEIYVQLQQIIGMMKDMSAVSAQVLVKRLLHSDEQIRDYIYQILNDIPGPLVVPALLEALNQPEPMQKLVAMLLLKHPDEAIPALVRLLADYERGDVAEAILLQFSSEILFSQIPELDVLIGQARVRRALLGMSILPGIERQLRVFLCHFSDDVESVDNLYRRLESDGVNPWFAEEDLLSGQEWQQEISKALHASDAVLICLSHDFNGAEYGRKETQLVFNMIDERSEGSIFLLPVRLEECNIPEQLKRWECVDLFKEQGYERLLRALSLWADQILDNYYWQTYQRGVKQTLFEQGTVGPAAFSNIPIRYVDGLFKRFMHEYPDVDLEYQESLQMLRLRSASIVQKMENLLKPVIHCIVDGVSTSQPGIRELEGKLEELLQEFSTFVGFKVVRKRSSKGFAAFLIETGITFENIRIPKWLPFFVSLDHEISDWTIEHLRRLLLSGDLGSEIQVAILILYCDNQKLDIARRRLANRLGNVHARDIIVLNHEDLLEIVAAKDPENMLLTRILSQMNLVAVAPYTVAGPTPPDFFFGREHELREISDHLTTKSYILIGGRLIGKTSIVNRLHCKRLPDYGFRTLAFDCSITSSHEAFLSASIRDWKPGFPTNPPTTFRELLQNPPEDKPLVLLLDEADKFVPIDHENNWQFFNMLRALINSKRLQVVLSGERTLHDAMKDPTSPLFNFANPILLGPLDYSAIEELITWPMRRLGIAISNQNLVVDRIYEFTAGHPNVVQRLCRRLIERLNEQGIRRISLDDVLAIIENPHFQEYDFLQTYWESATLIEKIITLVLSYEAKIYHLREVRQLLSERAHIQPSAEDTKDALDRLVELRSILKHTQNGYEFAVKAFPLVLVNTTTVEDLLEVLVEKYNKVEHHI